MPGDSRQALEEIFHSISAGRIDEARSLCRSKLESAPDDVNLIALFGAILLKAGEHDEAERHLLRAVELAPTFAKPCEDLGALYLGRKDAQRAVTFFEKAVALDGSQALARRGLAVALHQAGRTGEAEAIRAGIQGSSPAAQAVAQAEALRRSGDPDRAEQLCRKLLKSAPEDIAALRLLAVIATDDERYVAAEGLLRRIVELVPGNILAVRDLGRFLGDRGRYPEAIDLLEEAAAHGGINADLQLTLGDMLGIVGRSDDALRAYENCLSQEPDEVTALLGRAHMLRITGRSEEAIRSYRRCTEMQPEIGDAWWNLMSMHGFIASAEEIASMSAQIDTGRISTESEVAFRFALARAFEQRTDFDSAWAQYVAGNAAKRGLIKYDPVETEVQQRAIKAAFDTALPKEKQASTPADKTPVFIVGMPRSGSTLLEQILASHSMVEGCGELPYIIMISTAVAANRADGAHYPEITGELDASQLTGLGRSYLHHTSTHRDDEKPFFTDKMPANFSHVGFIRQILPHAKIIDARRDPVATCVANFRQLFAQGKNQSYDLIELAEYYLLYADVMNHWDDVLPGAVLRVHYEDVVSDIDREARRMLEFCGLPFEDACVDYYKSKRPVNTASSEQVRRPIYKSAIEYWRHYEAHLDELREVLAPVLQERIRP